MSQNAFNLTRITFICMWICKYQRIAQHFLKWNSLERQQGVPSWYGHHQRIVPDVLGDDPVADLIRSSEPYVVQVVVQPFDLLCQWNLEQTYLDLRFFLTAQRKEGREAR